MAKRKKLKSNVKEQPNNSTGLVISNNNLFAEKLNLLKEFSGQLPKETNLPTVPTEGGLFGWFNHNVTGDELNNLTENIQDRMIEQNITLVKVVQEIATVYDTFSALDNVYVQEILIAINTAFKAIDEVRAANGRISVQQEDISGAQQDIKQVINQQKQIIQVLKNFKEKLEKLKHLYDIDKIFSSSQNFQTKIETLEQISAEQRVNIEKASETQTRFLESLKSLSDLNNIFSEKIRKLSETLGELTKLSSDLEKAVEQCKKDQIGTAKAIESIKNGQESFEKSLEEQKTGIERLSATQKEFAISLSKAKEAGDKLSEKFAQSVQETGQRFSEIERATEKRNNEYAEKWYSFEVAVEKCEQATRDFYLKINLEIEQASNNVDKKYETVQNELTAIRNENATLLKSLLMAKVISITSLALSLVLFILFLTGVIR